MGKSCQRFLQAALCAGMVLALAPSAGEKTEQKTKENAHTSILVEADALSEADRAHVSAGIDGCYILSYDSKEDAECALERLKGTKGVEAEGDTAVSVFGDYLSWGPESIGVGSFTDLIPQTTEVTVAVIDTGVDYTHEELAGRVTSYDWDYVGKDGDAMDENGHGTHVAGIIADTTGENVKIAAYRITDKYGNASMSGLIEAILQATADGVDVINISMGAKVTNGSTTLKMLKKAINAATKQGVVVVAAAGNGNTDIENIWPACYDPVVSVAALTNNDEELVAAAYSNYGDKLDLCAPGTSIQSLALGGGYKTMSGTSMATPFVSASFALLKGSGQELSSDEMTEVLTATAVDLGDVGFDMVYGYGEVDLAAAANYLIEKASEPQVTTWQVSYVLNGGTASKNAPETYVEGEGLVLEDSFAPTKTGSTFTGWYLDALLKKPVTEISATQTGDVTLYAGWKAVSYTITYKLDGGTNNAKNPSTYTGKKAVVLYQPTKSGYTFAGWYSDVKLKKQITKIASGSGDVTVYAKWKAKKSQTVSFSSVKYNASKATLKRSSCSTKLSAKAKTTLTYTLMDAPDCITLTKAGKLTVKKGTPKGTYTATVRASASETAAYAPAEKECVVTVVVK